MTHGVGIARAEEALSALEDMTEGVKPITLEEYQQRVAKAQQLMQEKALALCI